MCFLSNQFAGFLDDQYLWKESNDILVSIHGVSPQEKVTSETIPLVGCCQFGLSFSQISRFFHHQYLWKESVDKPVIVHGVIHQGKVAS